jgi:integrase
LRKQQRWSIGEEVIDAPKTRRSRRTIDLDPDTAAMLERHRSEQSELLLRLGVTSPVGARVCTNEIGDPMRPGSIGQAFGRLVVAAGVPLIRLHNLRHTTRPTCSWPESM